MRKNCFINWLFISSSRMAGCVVDGVQHGLAQVGPDFCILREPIFDALFDATAVQGELLIEFDGDHREVSVSVSSNHPSSQKSFRFARFRSLCPIRSMRPRSFERGKISADKALPL
jgi:hypothetical protein